MSLLFTSSEKHPALQSSVLEHTDKLFPRNWILKQNGFHGKGPANECSRIPRDDLLFRVATAEEDEFDAFLYTFGLQKDMSVPIFCCDRFNFDIQLTSCLRLFSGGPSLFVRPKTPSLLEHMPSCKYTLG